MFLSDYKTEKQNLRPGEQWGYGGGRARKNGVPTKSFIPLTAPATQLLSPQKPSKPPECPAYSAPTTMENGLEFPQKTENGTAF